MSPKGKFMNNNYCIITDSGCDLPRDMAKELDVTVLDLTVLVDGYEPVSDSQVDLKEFYALLREQKNASTATINIDDFLSAMEEELKEGISFSGDIAKISAEIAEKSIKIVLIKNIYLSHSCI